MEATNTADEAAAFDVVMPDDAVTAPAAQVTAPPHARER
jgi:hypothetical protein